MNNKIYEKHTHPDMNFPFILHKDFTEFVSEESSYYHWHESIEILNCISGSGICIINGRYYNFAGGDTIIINPYSAHVVLREQKSDAYQQDGVYYCLIIDKSFFSSLNISCAERSENPLIRDKNINETFERMYGEMQKKELYWKQSIKALVTSLVVDLMRTYCKTDYVLSDKYKNNIAGNVIEYLYRNLDSQVTIDAISKEFGFNKYYLCHSFKEITGQSIVDFLNMLRCNNAKKLLMSGKCTVGEAAEQSGFTSLSYFSKIYKRYFGHVPSYDK